MHAPDAWRRFLASRRGPVRGHAVQGTVLPELLADESSDALVPARQRPLPQESAARRTPPDPKPGQQAEDPLADVPHCCLGSRPTAGGVPRFHGTAVHPPDTRLSRHFKIIVNPARSRRPDPSRKTGPCCWHSDAIHPYRAHRRAWTRSPKTCLDAHPYRTLPLPTSLCGQILLPNRCHKG